MVKGMALVEGCKGARIYAMQLGMTIEIEKIKRKLQKRHPHGDKSTKTD